MKFKHCRVCKGRMSSSFSYCPQCGGHNPRVGRWSALMMVLVLGFVAIRFTDGYASSLHSQDIAEIGDTILVPVADIRRY